MKVAQLLVVFDGCKHQGVEEVLPHRDKWLQWYTIITLLEGIFLDFSAPPRDIELTVDGLIRFILVQFVSSFKC